MSASDAVRRTPLVDFAVLAGFVILCLAVGWIGSAVTLPNIPGWYASLEKPFFTPPNWVFGPVWTALYILMAIAAWLVWRAPTRRDTTPLAIFFCHLVLNFGWSAVFFGLQSPLGGLIVIAALWAAIVWMMAAFRPHSRTASLLLVPYILWVSYAAALNAAVWAMN